MEKEEPGKVAKVPMSDKWHHHIILLVGMSRKEEVSWRAYILKNSITAYSSPFTRKCCSADLFATLSHAIPKPLLDPLGWCWWWWWWGVIKGVLNVPALTQSAFMLRPALFVWNLPQTWRLILRTNLSVHNGGACIIMSDDLTHPPKLNRMTPAAQHPRHFDRRRHLLCFSKPSN